MNRRDLIKLGAVAVSGTTIAQTFALSQHQRSGWQPDGVASVARVGVLTPDFDPVPESEMAAMAPAGVSIHAARVRRQEGGARAFAEPPGVDDAVGELATLAPRVILFAYTSSSYALGANMDATVRARLERRSGQIPVLLTCPVATEALRGLTVRRIALVHPPWFTDELVVRGQDYFNGRGFEVVKSTRISPHRTFTEVPPTEVFEWTRRNVPAEAEAVFVAGNGLRAIGTIAALEDDLRRPVLTANQVLFWQALRLAGVASQVTQYGRIFTEGS